jgi:hypothetical protein
MGCLGVALISLHSYGGGTLERTLSCPARKRWSSYDPTYTRCSCAHASLYHYKRTTHDSHESAGYGIRFGAVSSALCSLVEVRLRRVVLTKHTYAGGFANVDGEFRFLPEHPFSMCNCRSYTRHWQCSGKRMLSCLSLTFPYPHSARTHASTWLRLLPPRDQMVE